MVVCLGWQLDARAWVDAYNRNRPVNNLCGGAWCNPDRKLGGIIKHEPLTAQASAQREGDRLVVEVQDVVSPTIMQRLNLEQGVFRAQITDWRAVVDCILIDPAYNGQVFHVALVDVPERKQDLVAAATAASTACRQHRGGEDHRHAGRGAGDAVSVSWCVLPSASLGFHAADPFSLVP